MKYLIYPLLLLISNALIGQQVSTIFNSSTHQIDDALLLDDAGNLYGSHYMGSKVYKITPNGMVSTVYSGLNTPNGLAFDSQDNMYVVDNVGNRIYKIDSAGNLLFQVTVSNPSGIIKSIDSDTMIITQYTGSALRQLAPNGVINTQPMHYGYPLNGPVGLVYGKDSSLYIGNFTDRKIFRYKNDSLHYVADLKSGINSSLGFLTLANGILYATSFQANKIYGIHPDYIDSTWVFAGSSAGNTNGNLSQAKFNSPNGIVASKGGDSLYISDFITGNVRLISGLLTGIKPLKMNENSLSIAPNPSRGIVHVTSYEKLIGIEIYNTSGQLIYLREFPETYRYKLELNFSPGIYLIRGLGKQHTSHSRLLIE